MSLLYLIPGLTACAAVAWAYARLSTHLAARQEARYRAEVVLCEMAMPETIRPVPCSRHRHERVDVRRPGHILTRDPELAERLAGTIELAE